MSKSAARNSARLASGYETSLPRSGIALLLVLLGIAWMCVYIFTERHHAQGLPNSSNPLPWMGDLARWNYLIGFLLIFAGLMVAAHKLTPLGRGQGVVVGMLFCFLFGLAWIVVYYFVGSNTTHFAPMDDLQNYNLLVGIGFMAVGFSFATKWE